MNEAVGLAIVALVFTGPSLAAVVRYRLVDRRREMDMERLQLVVDDKVSQTVSAPQRMELVKEAEQSIDDPRLLHLTRLMAQTLHAPLALVTLVEDNRQCFLAATDTINALDGATETPLKESWCRYVVATKSPLEINDATLDPLVRNTEAVTKLHIKSYLGMPIKSKDVIIGSCCVLDTKPRRWTAAEYQQLAEFASLVDTIIGGDIELGKA